MMSVNNQEKRLADLLNFAPDVLERWRKVGLERGLTSDGHIAKFLMTQYEHHQIGVEQVLRCLKCDGPLSLLCADCDLAGWSAQTQDPEISLSVPESNPLTLVPPSAQLSIGKVEHERAAGTEQHRCSVNLVVDEPSTTHSLSQEAHTDAFQTGVSTDPNNTTAVNKSTTFSTSGTAVNLVSTMEPSAALSGGCSGSKQVKIEMDREMPLTECGLRRYENGSVVLPLSTSMHTSTRGRRWKRSQTTRKNTPTGPWKSNCKLTTAVLKAQNCGERAVNNGLNNTDVTTQPGQQCFPCTVELNDISSAQSNKALSQCLKSIAIEPCCSEQMISSTLPLLPAPGKRPRKGRVNRSMSAKQSASKAFTEKAELNHPGCCANSTSTIAETPRVRGENTLTSDMDDKHTDPTNVADELTVHFCDTPKSEESVDPEQTLREGRYSQLQDADKVLAESIQNLSGKTSLQTLSAQSNKALSQCFSSIAIEPCCSEPTTSSLENSECTVVKRKRKKSASRITYTCDECGARYLQPQNLKYHIMSEHRGERPFVCENCGKRYLRQADLNRHTMQRHTRERPFKCDKCEAAFAVNSSLQTHLEMHATKRMHVCHVCGADFLMKNSLRQHLLIHAKERPHKCPECDLRFTQRGNMLIHQRTHTGEKPFQCTYCSRRFRGQSSYKNHVMTHTGEKPFSCQDCGKSFISSSTLKIHCRVHTGDRPYKCAVCQFGFRSSGSLRRHMLVHTGDKPHICVECGQAFSRSHHLKVHVNSKHSITKKKSEPVVVNPDIPVIKIKISPQGEF